MEHGESTIRLLKIMQENPEISQRDLAKRIGISIGVTNHIIKALIEAGMIKTQRFLNFKNKWTYRYLSTPENLEEKAIITGNL